MLVFKHRQTKQEITIDENAEGLRVYKNSPSWQLIDNEIEKELQIEDNAIIDEGIYAGLTKAQLKEICQERHITFKPKDRVDDLKDRLHKYDTVHKRDIKPSGQDDLQFRDNLIK